MSKTPGRSVTCVNCAVERLFGQAPGQPKARPLVVGRQTLLIELRDRPEVTRRVD